MTLVGDSEGIFPNKVVIDEAQVAAGHLDK
jgi:hypothetical protein